MAATTTICIEPGVNALLTNLKFESEKKIRLLADMKKIEETAEFVGI